MKMKCLCVAFRVGDCVCQPVHPARLTTQAPYGVPCIRELLRFLVAMVNRRDRTNSDAVITLGLSLLTVALETGGASLARFPSLMQVCPRGLWLS